MTFGHEPAEFIQQRLYYKGRVFSFEVNKLRLPKGTTGEWECVRHPGGALAVPITEDGKLVLVRQYRFSVQGRLLEFPAGTIEIGEDPFNTIQREIEEETGYRAHRWQTLGKFPLAPGYSDEYIYAFLAQDLEKLEIPPEQDIDEDMEVVLMSFDEFEAAISSGEPIDGKTIASYFMARLYLNQS
ncbi:NUDIX hydrolase [Chroococcus sp. FPU101]|uniref:NUDIX hydrolase n=1 Tax=Chroococcus sp. FPU101 TaxID=1974212 RepID=UPI001A8CFDED|nr:NUDIX hydrolase [Chroococcus sp. FPU101]GFE71121.1 ADP-ribose pyrophosphatase [Chroococcus sp. FPU101]